MQRAEAAAAASCEWRGGRRILRLEDVTVAALLRGAGGYNGAVPRRRRKLHVLALSGGSGAGTPRHDNRVRHLGRCTDDVLILHYQKPAALLRLHAALQVAERKAVERPAPPLPVPSGSPVIATPQQPQAVGVRLQASTAASLRTLQTLDTLNSFVARMERPLGASVDALPPRAAVADGDVDDGPALQSETQFLPAGGPSPQQFARRVRTH